LLLPEKIYRPEWREVAILLAGILRVKPRKGKVDGLVKAILERAGTKLAGPRYQELMDAVLGIFDREKAGAVELQVRFEAADALGQAGDPRIPRDNWVTRMEGHTA
jgi:hypothetical protein